ncbi:MAG: phosphoenolpyruvate carboxylase [Alkalispirochaetaceae bacterium]
MRRSLDAFQEHVALKYHIYNGLFLSLPFEEVRQTGIMLPLFAQYCRDRLEEGAHPSDIVHTFFEQRMGSSDRDERVATLFRFMQIVERQVVLFDALEDAAFREVNDMEGPGTLKDMLGRIENGDLTEELRRYLQEFRVRVVLTAHPTQFYPDEILGIITDLSRTLRENSLQEIYDILLQMGKTPFLNKEKPTPFDEARSLLWFLENVFYQVMPEIHRQLVEHLYADPSEAVEQSPKLELGFWPGGDRDGNPFVTSNLTREIGEMLRRGVLRKYLAELGRLRRRLTFRGVMEPLARINDRLLVTLAPWDHAGELAEPPDEAVETPYGSSEEFLEDLKAIHRQLYDHHGGLFAHLLEELMYKVRIFGFHFASMDLRQDSRVHGRVIEELLRHAAPAGLLNSGSYTLLTDDEKLDFIGKLRTIFPIQREFLEDLPEGITRDTVESLRAARQIQERNGERGVHRYIISNSRSAANVLEVWLLAQFAGWFDKQLAIDIVPLFETVEDLRRAPEIMEKLYNNRIYRRHLNQRGGTQTIMLGFSDGTKDGGYVAANWEIYRAKERLTEVSRQNGVTAIFFEGRGGPPARGGGNTHKFYRSLGSRIESKQIHLTVQGQTISSNFGTEVNARYNLEQLVTAGIENHLFPEEAGMPTEEDRGKLDRLSELSRNHYLELKDDAAFLSYLKEMTPLTYYGETNIASRPTSRGNTDELRFEDLRAIPFVGAWSQMKQNVPGYYGFGTAMEQMIDEGEDGWLKDLYHRSLFFRTLVENSMQSLSKVNFPLTRYIREERNYRRFWDMLEEEQNRTRNLLLEISGQEQLLERDPSIRESIRLREAMILPILVVQQHALSRIRTAQAAHAHGLVSEHDNYLDAYRKIVIKSLVATINASRNSV